MFVTASAAELKFMLSTGWVYVSNLSYVQII